MSGHPRQVGLRDFDVVAEYLVVADFQGVDAGALPFLQLDLSDPGLPVPTDRAQFVEVGVVAVANQSPIFDRRWGLRVDRLLDLSGQLREIVPGLSPLAQERGGTGRQHPGRSEERR